MSGTSPSALTPGEILVINEEANNAAMFSAFDDSVLFTEAQNGTITSPQLLADLNQQYAYYGAYQAYLASERAGTAAFDPTFFYGTTIPTSGIQITCYAKGTRVLTPGGEVPVEALTEGGMVATASGGCRPIRWIGYRSLDLTRHPAPAQVQPIRIRAEAFGPGVPSRDLLLSPEHAVLCNDVLIPARLLVNGGSIVREAGLTSITYYHIELDSHDILLAENLPAESYLDTGNRGLFSNAATPMTLYPALTNDQARREAASCVPFADEPAQVEPVWRALLARSKAIGWPLPIAPATTNDPALHLMVDGRRLAPVSVAAGRYTFILPRADVSVRLISRVAVPSTTSPWIADDRCLGVLVRGIALREPGSVTPVALDNPALTDGWWSVEWHTPTVLRRWTNGNAVVPVAAACVTQDGPYALEIEVAATQAYVLPLANDAQHQQKALVAA